MKTAAQAVLVSVAAAAACFAVLVALALLLPQDQQAIRRHLSEAIASGEINAQTRFGPFQKRPIYRNVYNCLLFNMALAPAKDRLADAMSNAMASTEGLPPDDVRVPPFPDCQALLRALSEAGGDGLKFVQYDRYILGARIVGRVLLTLTSVAALWPILLAISYALIGAIGIVALVRLRRARDAIERTHAAGYAAIATCFALFYGAHYYDATLGFAPLDWVQFAFILVSLVGPLGDMRPAALAVYAASYGSAIAIFEFMTGGIPLALALLPLLLALGFRGEPRDYVGRLTRLWACFCAAVVASFAIKKLFTIAFFGGSDDFLANLLYRTYGQFDTAADAHYSVSYFVGTYFAWSASIAWGSRHLGAALILLSLITIALMTWRSRKSGPPDRYLRWACWLGLAAVAAWMIVFLNHALLHAFFMVRLLVVPIIAATVLVVTAWVARPAGAGT